jgi:hypothetical protein
MNRAWPWLTRVRFRFSLKLLLLLFTALIVWIGIKSNQVRRERAAVVVLTRCQIDLIYDYQHRAVRSVQRPDGVGSTPYRLAMNASPRLPSWLADSPVRDYFQSVTAVEVGELDENRLRAIAQALKALPHLEEIYLWGGGTCWFGENEHDRAGEKLRSEFPHLKFTRLFIDVVG